jgi:hypothetical protein
MENLGRMFYGVVMRRRKMKFKKVTKVLFSDLYGGKENDRK